MCNATAAIQLKGRNLVYEEKSVRYYMSVTHLVDLLVGSLSGPHILHTQDEQLIGTEGVHPRPQL